MTERPKVTFVIPPNSDRARCRSCGAGIVWILTTNAKRMPVNIDTGESHFATCKDAQRWRES